MRARHGSMPERLFECQEARTRTMIPVSDVMSILIFESHIFWCFGVTPHFHSYAASPIQYSSADTLAYSWRSRRSRRSASRFRLPAATCAALIHHALLGYMDISISADPSREKRRPPSLTVRISACLSICRAHIGTPRIRSR
jgi:hypothetical protein